MNEQVGEIMDNQTMNEQAEVIIDKKMMNCKVCNFVIAKGAKTCPNCGATNRKSIFKKIWLWIILIVIAFFVICISSSDSNDAPEVSETNQQQQETTDESKETTPELTEIAKRYIYISENASTTFKINEKALDFINKNQKFFPGDESIQGAISDFVDWDLNYNMLSKNINKYGDKLISVNGDVIDIYESDNGDYTYIHISDYEGKNFIIHYLGSLDNVFEGTNTWAYVLPLDKISFENMGGSYTEAIACAGCYVYNPEVTE